MNAYNETPSKSKETFKFSKLLTLTNEVILQDLCADGKQMLKSSLRESILSTTETFSNYFDAFTRTLEKLNVKEDLNQNSAVINPQVGVFHLNLGIEEEIPKLEFSPRLEDFEQTIPDIVCKMIEYSQVGIGDGKILLFVDNPFHQTRKC
jgi:hypothetical protein